MHISFERTDEETPLGTVLLSHGYAEHSGRYVHLRSALTRAGYDVAFYAVSYTHLTLPTN